MKKNVLIKFGLILFAISIFGTTFAKNFADEMKKRNYQFDEVNRMLQSKSFANYMHDQRKQMNEAVDQSQSTGKGVGLNIPKHYYENNSDVNYLPQTDLKQLAKNGREEITAPIVFVSFSMPESDIKNLINEMHKVKGGVVIRGLIDDDFKKTTAKISSLQTKDNAGVLIDPTLFQLFEIKTVPTYIIPLQPIEPCMDKDKSCKQPKHIKATGAVSFRYVLDLVERTGSAEEKLLASKYSAMLKGQ